MASAESRGRREIVPDYERKPEIDRPPFERHPGGRRVDPATQQRLGRIAVEGHDEAERRFLGKQALRGSEPGREGR